MSANYRVVAILVLLALSAAFSTASVTTNYDPKPQPKKFVGAYYTAFDGITTNGVVTFHSDGTVTGNSADMFEFSLARQSRRSTPFIGYWKQIGRNRISVTATFFLSGVPSPQAPDGSYSQDGVVVKTTYVAIFSKNMEAAGSLFAIKNYVARAYAPTQNPNVDTPLAVVELPDGGIGYRVAAD